MKILIPFFLLMGSSLIAPHWAWSSETLLRLPNAQEIAAAQAGEADFEVSPWTDLKQAMEQHQEKAFFFAMDLFSILKGSKRNNALGSFLQTLLKFENAWRFPITEPERLRLVLKWLKRRLLEPGNAPTWTEIPKGRFVFHFSPIRDLELIRTLGGTRFRYQLFSDLRREVHLGSHEGEKGLNFLHEFLLDYLLGLTSDISWENNIAPAIVVFSFLPKSKRTEHTLGILFREIQRQKADPFVDYPILLKEWPETEMGEYEDWLESVRDQAGNRADRDWASAALERLNCQNSFTPPKKSTE